MKIKTSLSLVAVWLGANLLSFAQEPHAAVPSAATAADQVFAEFHAVVGAQDRFVRDERWRTTAPAERDRISAAGGELVCALGERILADFPNDPRRWEAVGAMIRARRQIDGADAAARKAAWEKRRAELAAMALTAADAPTAAVEAAAASEIMASVYRTVATPDLPRALHALDCLAARSPNAPMRESYEEMYVDALRKSDEAAAMKRLEKLTTDPEPAVVTKAKNKLAALALATTSLQLKFPDLDGHEIDLANYRGKVVLLDFWATWCVPCMEEMPGIKAVYQKYHDQGFEVIGITDDIVPKDPEHPRGTEKNLAQLKAFLAKENMPWPQLWDTRPKDRPGVKALLQQFDVHSLPTGMLFDQQGRLVTTDNHGKLLEANVRKLLGL